MPPQSISELATTLATTPERLRDVLRQTIRRVPRSRYYVFRITGERSTATAAPSRPRTVAAFPSPDAALSFAQRNGYGSNVQLRPVPVIDLLVRMLTDAAIGAVLFLDDRPSEGQRGFGPGLKVERDQVVRQLQEEQRMEHSRQTELSAAQYDALQFGVDFADRAEFRVALTQQIEAIIEGYQPPPGSIDHGPRSIFATTAVEEWLKSHGFPRAYQRRWIDVAGDPQWGGAVELCEIDAGTHNHLLIQLLIHGDETGRQYIKRVNITA